MSVRTEALLEEILKRTRTTTRGATIVQLIPLFGDHRSTAFKRVRALLKAGLIARVPGTNGEYILTQAGLVRFNSKNGEPR